MEQKLILDEFRIIKKIGSGSFSEVYLINDNTNTHKAIKIENKNSNHMLMDEYKVYQKLNKRKIDNVPHVYSFIQTPEYNIMEMELLDRSIEYLFSSMKKFQTKTILKLGYEMTYILQQVHNIGYIHRDIKPHNFMLNKENKLYIMDFGLSKRYKINGVHIPYKTDRSLVGTARYASINVHNGVEPSRRDDLISVCYMLIYFCKGSLPWQGMAKEINKNKSKDHLKEIGNMKLCYNINKLCEDVPSCLKDYLLYTQNLKYDERPDYQLLMDLFVNFGKENNIELIYEWSK